MAEEHAADPSWFRQPCILGVDEAGRGPVLGPMVYGVAWCPKSWKDELKARKFDDSKKLTEAQRDDMYEKIADEPNLAFAVDFLSARFISSSMLGAHKLSLNQMAFDSTCRLIQQALDRGAKLEEVYIDTVGDPTRYRERFEQKFPGIDFTVQPKADAEFPIVSAASIVAKVTRDKSISEASAAGTQGDKDGLPLGSGYPGDEVTKAWLNANIDPVFGFPSLVRFSWRTAEDLMRDNCVPMRWKVDDEDGVGQTTLASFASRQGRKRMRDQSVAKDRHSFFRARKIERVTTEF